ncbi:MAG: ribbon-helix-helix domain-containing protein [Roseibium album]|uniref:ribbon-helix-helix domain-containing protein n=1 Tax=Roseibium album TaxID=311410 RepID=UPI000CF0B819|nr:ribbon-helix-helix domain-containing protein [Roseibium album]MBG6145006.1 putative DNA-binding ribbon-helix-helix protein [Labrenzia sp. EL_142]MBG6156820.1 putative DNA-binding ribbon-helix-helix protein [Labrenzia sp. EL_162]MBG6173169.1 putative DNA-binding ribbon-helix-helix protein [Labrenzia sp. EL_132]MBG6195240.1 putative DNA-binding ribbon-helix-helix protein [Labrenzia sp. EL_159]MBG6228061.1 putative DNA-binding ribbon-helix-helix protein [Labrenzia sp. EL_208]
MAFVKRSLSLHGHRTSLALEPEFWEVVDENVAAEQRSLASLIAEIDDNRDPDDPLSSAVRVWVVRKIRPV